MPSTQDYVFSREPVGSRNKKVKTVKAVKTWEFSINFQEPQVLTLGPYLT